MNLFSTRRDPAYYDLLAQTLSFDELKKTALKVDPISAGGKEYTRLIRIDFVGISCTVLLDRSGSYIGKGSNYTRIPEQTENIFDNISNLNDEGYFVKFRFLLVYPYSSYAFSLIRAVSTPNRATVEEPSFQVTLDPVESIDETIFRESTIVVAQRRCLQRLETLLNRNKTSFNHDSSPNKVTVRFTPFSINECALIINDTAFCDSYSSARKRVASRDLAFGSPLVCLDQQADDFQFKCAKDHFRYFWGLDTTLDCEDATKYGEKRNGLKDVKKPQEIDYTHKSERLRSVLATQGIVYSDLDVALWDAQATRLLRQYSQEPTEVLSGESLFIGCSWELQETGKWKPDARVEELRSWLEEDFGSMIEINLLDGPPGKRFPHELDRLLERSTMAIVVMTSDLVDKRAKKEKWFAKPNVYHEVGYLMSKLPEGRVVALREGEVHYPSNIQSNVFIQFERKKTGLALAYDEIAEWIHNNCKLVNDNARNEALARHIERIRRLVLKGVVPSKQFAAIEKSITNKLKGSATRV